MTELDTIIQDIKTLLRTVELAYECKQDQTRYNNFNEIWNEMVKNARKDILLISDDEDEILDYMRNVYKKCMAIFIVYMGEW